MNVVHIIVHTPEQVREIIREARAITDEQGDGDMDVWIFEQACQLLGQRSTVVQADAPMAGLPTMIRRG